MRRWWWLGVIGCASSDAPPVQDTDPPVTEGVTFHADVRPILERRCVGCHEAGGIAPIDLRWTPDADARLKPWFPLIAHQVATGAMPPWPVDESCHPTKEPRNLPRRELAVFEAWAEADYPMGDPDDYVAPELPVDDGPPHDLELASDEPYTPDVSRPDDYRCFVVDPSVDEDLWITAFDVAPDRVEIVHHVLLYRLDAADAGLVAGLDAEDEGPGYTCFGSPGTWSADTIAGWAPGQRPERYAPGTARKVEKGSVLVVQVHYNTQNLQPGAPVPADRTVIRLWTLAPGERARNELFSLPIAVTDLEIPAGEPSVVVTDEVDLDRYLRRNVPLRGTFPHMHQLGTSIRLDVIREDGTEDCVVSVPDWDFHWQQSYQLPDDRPVWVSRRDRLRVTCAYDNSPANQPLVGGVRQEPRDVTWGEGSGNEMCLVYVYFTLPAELGAGDR